MPVRTSRENSKRNRLSPTAQAPSDSSDVSNGSVSEASALQSTPGVSDDTQQPTLSPPSSQDEDDESSESDVSDTSSEESSSDDDEEDEEEEIITLGGPKKPEIDPKRIMEEASKIHARLQELIPKLRQANAELAEKGPSANMEDVGDDEQHIEMDLGLGVLEEKHEEEGDALNEAGGKDTTPQEEESKPDVIQSLLGANKDHAPPSIEEVDGV